MKKILKAFLLLIMAMTVSVALSGCNFDNDKVNDVTQEENVLTITVKIYDVAEDKNEIKKVELSSEEIIDVDKIIDVYKDEYARQIADGDENILNEVKNELPSITGELKEDVAILTFSDILSNMGSGVEGNFIENLAYSIRKNIENIKGININVNGEEYASGHIIFETNELIKGE